MSTGGAAPPSRVAGAAPGDRDRFARRGAASRVWAIASVHGERGRLAAVHGEIARRFREGDRVVWLGNLLGHGPDVIGVVDEALSFRSAVIGRGRGFACECAVLRGAQEEMWQKLLQLQFAANPREVFDWMMGQGVEATLRAYGGDPRQGAAACREGTLSLTRWTAGLRKAMDALPGHRHFMTTLRRAAFTRADDGGALLFVNAGIDPARPLDAQKDAFWWGGARLLEMDEPYAGYRRVVRGFDRAHGGIVESAFALSIDGGSGFGGALIAACIDAAGGVVDRIER
jgi:hypothetical protein